MQQAIDYHNECFIYNYVKAKNRHNSLSWNVGLVAVIHAHCLFCLLLLENLIVPHLKVRCKERLVRVCNRS